MRLLYTGVVSGLGSWYFSIRPHESGPFFAVITALLVDGGRKSYEAREDGVNGLVDSAAQRSERILVLAVVVGRALLWH